MLANLSLERLRFFPTPDEVFTLRADPPLELRGSPNRTRKALWPPPKMNSARGAWHKGVRPEGATRKEARATRAPTLGERGSAGSGGRPKG